jgi:hypothetical protein
MVNTLAAFVARDRDKLLRLATAELPENFGALSDYSDLGPADEITIWRRPPWRVLIKIVN